MSKTTEKQETPTQQLRSRIVKSSIPLSKFAKKAGIPYYRLRRIVNEGTPPTHDEGELMEKTLDVFLSEVSQSQSTQKQAAGA